MHMVYVGLGSNLNEPVNQIKKALKCLNELPEVAVIKASNLYENPPFGPIEQPSFVNAVAQIETSLEPLALLKKLQAIELTMGRVKTVKWGPRVIDIDILLYDNLEMQEKDLSIPHPGLQERACVACLLYEVSPHLILPGGIPIKTITQKLDSNSLKLIDQETFFHESTIL